MARIYHLLLLSMVVNIILPSYAMVADDRCDPIKCPNTDCGSCGGSACCKLQLWFEGGESEDIAQKLAESMRKGIDGTYELELTYSGDLGLSDVRDRENPDEDADFVGQLTRYPVLNSEDSHLISFSLETRYRGVLMNVFSASSKAGSYCDSGQNYKNIIEFVNTINEKYVTTHLDKSCYKYVPDGEVLRRLAEGAQPYF